MSSPSTDLRSLRRVGVAAEAVKTTDHAVPRPRRRWRTRVLLPMAILLATGAVLAYAARDVFVPRIEVLVAPAVPKATQAMFTSDAAPADAGADAPPEGAPAVGAAAGGGGGPVLAQAPGWVEPAPYAVSVPALVEGVVREVLVLEGERIEVGQVVARLIDDNARLRERAADAALAEQTADVERARASLATAEAQVHVQQAEAAELRDEVVSKKPLVAAGGLSEGMYRRMEIRLQGLDAKAVAAERVCDEWHASVKQGEAAMQSALVARDEARLALARTEVRSPVAGVVLARLVEPGSRISMRDSGADAGRTGMPGAIVRVYDPAKLQVRVDVPLADAAKIGVGTRAVVITEALPDAEFTGVVARVIHEANIQRNTVQFKVALTAPSPVLKPEMLMRVKLYPAAPTPGTPPGGPDGAPTAPAGATGGGGLALVIPAASITPTTDHAALVWIVDSSSGSPIARRREIATAPSPDEGFITATRGLTLTDRVILDAPPSLREGSRLVIRSTPAAIPSEEQP